MDKDKDMTSDMGAALVAGQLLSQARQPLRNVDGMTPGADEAGTPYVVVPPGSAVHALEHLLPRPQRKRAVVSVGCPESFVEYLAWHGSAMDSMIYAALDSQASVLRMECVLDDHSPDGPKWREHRCRFAPALSVEWRRWTESDRKRMKQAEFASWLEENRGDIASVEGMPDGAQILQMALNFEAAAEKRLKSNVSLRSGCRTFEFVDREDDTTRMRMEVFERFTIGLPVFYGDASAYPIEARLKYRNDGGALAFWFELIRPDRAFKQAAEEIVQGIGDKLGITIIYGLPEA